MAARDKYSFPLKCNDCKTEGRIHISEDDHMYMTDLRRALDGVDGPFNAQLIDKLEIVARCKKCNKIIKY